MSPNIRIRTITGLAIGVALFLQPVFGQQGQGQAPPPAPAPSPAPGGAGGGANIPPGGNVPPGQSPFPGQREPRMPQTGPERERTPFPEMQRPIFLSGKVVLDDGTPADNAVIERVCNGIARPEAYTDSKGRFSFQLGQNTAMMQDASVGSAADGGFGTPGGFPGGGGSRGGLANPRGGISERDLMGCEIRAVLPGFRSDIVNLGGRRAFDNPDVGTIVLRRLGNVEGTTISATSLQAPKDAKKALEEAKKASEKAQNAHKRKKDDEAKRELAKAEQQLQKAVEIYPKYAVAWYQLGMIQEQTDRGGEARKSYEQALSADAKYVSPYLQLALLAAKEKNWQEVADTTDRAVKLNPFDFPQAYFYNSVANYNLRKLDAAEKSAREAQKLDTQHRIPKVTHLLGIILAEKRDYTGAAEQMRSYLQFAPGAQDADTVRSQLAELEKMSGQAAKVTPQP